MSKQATKVAWMPSSGSNAREMPDSDDKRLIAMAQRQEWGAIELALKYASKDILNNQYRDESTGETILMLAAKDNRIVIMERLFELGVNINERTLVSVH